MLTRRQLLLAAAGGMAWVAYGPRRVLAGSRTASQTVTLSATATHTGQHLYLPFVVPTGVNRVEVSVSKGLGDAVTGAGLFDHRGAGYQTPGFRGMYGKERSRFFVAAHEASQSFLPGTIEPGTWTVVVPVLRVTVPTPVTATVALGFGDQLPPAGFGPEPGVVSARPGWYRGDLHCHTPESSDAWRSGSAMTPRQWADAARAVGLDFLAMTDHNVVSQNLHLAEDAGEGVLLMAGEEMTSFHGHATVSGIHPGDWLDWRQTPMGLPLETGMARVQDFLGMVGEMGGYVAAAHPMAFHLAWQFFTDGEADPRARPHGLEVWTGAFQPDDEAAVQKWDDLLRRGWRVWANGGSDLHGVRNAQGRAAGRPTTVVHARELSKPAVVAGLRRGRSFVTRHPEGAEVYLTASGPGGQRQTVGGTIYGGRADAARLEVLVRRAAGMRLVLLRDGVPLSVTVVHDDEQTVAARVPVGAGGYVRAEVRGHPFLDPAYPLAGRLDMEALTNPIFLVVGPIPPGHHPDDAPPPQDWFANPDRSGKH